MEDVLVEVSFDDSYSINKNVLTKNELDQLQSVCSRDIKYEQLTKRHIDLGRSSLWNDEDKNHEDFKILVDAYHIGGHSNIASLHRLLGLGNPKIEFRIQEQIKEIPEYNIEESLLHKLLSLESKLSMFNQAQQFNYKVGVHISDLGLLNVRYVDWVEDTCTEELQRRLDDGWRILAVCPQPDQRRPDYILGRNERFTEQ